MYLKWQALSKQCRPRWDAAKCGISSGSTLFATHPAIFRHTTLGGKLYLFKFQIKYSKELRYLNTKGKYGKVRDTEIKWSIISKSVMIIIFVEFIDQLINYPINCASLSSEKIQVSLHICPVWSEPSMNGFSDSEGCKVSSCKAPRGTFKTFKSHFVEIL